MVNEFLKDKIRFEWLPMEGEGKKLDARLDVYKTIRMTGPEVVGDVKIWEECVEMEKNRAVDDIEDLLVEALKHSERYEVKGSASRDRGSPE